MLEPFVISAQMNVFHLGALLGLSIICALVVMCIFVEYMFRRNDKKREEEIRAIKEEYRGDII